MPHVRGDKPGGEAHELGNGVIDSSGGSRSLQAPERRLAIKVALATGFWPRIRPGPKGPPLSRCIQGPEGPCSLRHEPCGTNLRIGVRVKCAHSGLCYT